MDANTQSKEGEEEIDGLRRPIGVFFQNNSTFISLNLRRTFIFFRLYAKINLVKMRVSHETTRIGTRTNTNYLIV